MTLDFSKVQIIKGLPDPKSKYWENFHDETLTSKILLPCPPLKISLPSPPYK
jgi:hypothetical protein